MIRPGMMPAISRSDTDTLSRLTLLASVASSTVSADGGISMSTPPIAMIGPSPSTDDSRARSISGSSDWPSIAVVAIVEPDRAEKIVPPRHRHDRQPPGHGEDQAVDGVDGAEGDAAAQQDVAHHQEERHGRQVEVGDRGHRASDERHDAVLAAQEDDGADDVGAVCRSPSPSSFHHLVGAIVFLGGENGIMSFIRGSMASIANFNLAPVPLFLVMGDILLRTGTAFRAIDAIDR